MQDAPWIREAEREGATYEEMPADLLLELVILYNLLED